MEDADIYLATSDRKEGWGAVINEAMNSGCAVVADHMMGAAPFLIRQGENGLIYEDGREDKLFRMTERLVTDRQLCRRLGCGAYQTITGEWNAENAAERLLDFCEEKKIVAQGPCSHAPVISERKMRRYIERSTI
jgi:glycosyltransferase involved in cell wall biosynthesis